MDREARTLLLACAAHGLVHTLELSTPALLLLIQREYGVGDLRMGQVVGLAAVLFGLGSLPAGFLVDRFGSRSLFVACMAGSALGVLGMAAAPTLGWFAAASALLGAAISLYHPAGTALLTHAMTPTGSVFAKHGMAGNVGIALSSLVMGGLGALFGWRLALGVLALPALAVAAGALSLQAPSVGELRARPQAPGDTRSFVLLLLAAGCAGVVYRGSMTFLPKFFSTVAGPEGAAATALGGALTTAALIVGVVGMYGSGRAIDRGLSRPRLLLFATVLQAPFLLGLGLLSASVGTLLPAAMGLAFFHFMTQPVANNLVADFTPARLRGLGYGLYFLMMFGAGSTGAAFAGWVSERHSLALVFPALAAMLLPGALATLGLREPAKR